MPTRWTGTPLSYNDFKSYVQTNEPAVVVLDHPFPSRGAGALAVKFEKRVGGKTITFTSVHIVEAPSRPLSAGLVASWCNTLGILPIPFPLDDTLCPGTESTPSQT